MLLLLLPPALPLPLLMVALRMVRRVTVATGAWEGRGATTDSSDDDLEREDRQPSSSSSAPPFVVTTVRLRVLVEVVLSAAADPLGLEAAAAAGSVKPVGRGAAPVGTLDAGAGMRRVDSCGGILGADAAVQPPTTAADEDDEAFFPREAALVDEEDGAEDAAGGAGTAGAVETLAADFRPRPPLPPLAAVDEAVAGAAGGATAATAGDVSAAALTPPRRISSCR